MLLADVVTRPATLEDPNLRVRNFYETDGWRWSDGRSGDARRWGTEGGGPLHAELEDRRSRLVRSLLGIEERGVGAPVTVVEFGGGGQPATGLFDGATRYTAVDFSRQGLVAARSALGRLGAPPAQFVEADVRAVPMAGDQFDVAYSAHMLYHLATRSDQARALREMARVVRPGGTLLVVTAKPYPWLFLNRCLRRLIADLPVVGAVADRLRPQPPLPFLPTPARWVRLVLAEHGETRLHAYEVVTPSFGRRFQERTLVGRLAWRGVAALERRLPRLALRVGSYFVVALHKPAERTG